MLNAVSYLAAAVFALRCLAALIKLILTPRYFRVYQRCLLAVLAGAMAVTVVCTSVEVGEKVLKLEGSNGTTDPIFTETLAIFKYDFHFVTEIVQVLLAIDILLLAYIWDLHRSECYLVVTIIGTIAGAFLIIVSPLILPAELRDLVALGATAGNVVTFLILHIIGRMLLYTSNERKKDPLAYHIRVTELRWTSFSLLLFSGYRLISQTLIWSYEAQDLGAELFSLLGPLMFVWILRNHRQSAYRLLWEEWQDVKTQFGTAFPEMVLVGFPMITLENQKAILRFRMRDSGEMIFEEMIDWASLERVHIPQNIDKKHCELEIEIYF